MSALRTATALAALCTTGAVFGCGSCRDAPATLGSPRGSGRGVETGRGEQSPAVSHRGVVQGNDEDERKASTSPDGTGGEPAVEDERPLPPLASVAKLVNLAVPGFGDAVVSLPTGARARKPVMLAIHGNYDRPDFQCDLWRSMVQDRGFILCPRGVARRDSPGPDDIRFTYEGKFAAELDAAVAALHERYGAWIDPGPMIYVGFSLGAILARGYVMRAPLRFDRMILIEGGASGWDARAFSKAGAARVLWACGQAPCVDAGRAAARTFERAKVASKVVSAKGAGHTYGGAVFEAVRAEWEWLVSGDPRWSSSWSPVRR